MLLMGSWREEGAVGAECAGEVESAEGASAAEGAEGADPAEGADAAEGAVGADGADAADVAEVGESGEPADAAEGAEDTEEPDVEEVGSAARRRRARWECIAGELAGGRTGRGLPEKGGIERAEIHGVVRGQLVEGRRDQRRIDRGAEQRAVVGRPTDDPAGGLDTQVVAHVGLDDHHVHGLLAGAGGGDEDLLHPVADLRQIDPCDLDGLVGEVHGGGGVGGDPRLRDHQ